MDISSIEFTSRLQSSDSFTIIDVREVLEFQTFNIGGQNIPLNKLINTIEDLDFDKEQEIVLICQRGLRSETATQLLIHQGFKNARNLKGGILALQKLKINTSEK